MKTLTVKNLHIQLDNIDESEVNEVLDSINEVLTERFQDTQPQILHSHIDSSDIEVEEWES